MRRRNGQMGKLMGWDKDSLIRQQRKNTNANNKKNDNNEYAKQTIYNTIFSQPSDWFEVRPQAAITELRNHEFHYISKKAQTPSQGSIQAHRNERERYLPAPQWLAIHELSSPCMLWNTSIGWFALASWLCSLPAPAHLLISWTWETEESLCFLSNK